MSRIAIHQPNFLPWLGYFHKISLVDCFVFFDDVQFPRGKTFGNRVKIKTNNGESWITVPVLAKGDLTHFNAILINNTIPWQRKILKTIELAYAKSAFFDRYRESFSEVFLAPYDRLIDLNVALIRYIAGQAGIKTAFRFSSEMNLGNNISAEDKILSILKNLKATVYVSGSGAGSRRYIDEDRFSLENIKIEWQHFASPEYPQLWGPFIPDLSIIDLLFNCGDKTREILGSCQEL